MIAIVNIGPDPDGDGPQPCEIRIGNRAIARFVHRHDDDLAAVLIKASRAVAARRSQPTARGQRGGTQ